MAENYFLLHSNRLENIIIMCGRDCNSCDPSSPLPKFQSVDCRRQQETKQIEMQKESETERAEGG